MDFINDLPLILKYQLFLNVFPKDIKYYKVNTTDLLQRQFIVQFEYYIFQRHLVLQS